MASSSGASSGSSMAHNSGSDGDLRQMVDQRKRKRMLSNRESARRSRMRKQKHLDDLTAQVCQLTKENNQIFTNLNMTSQLFLNVEAENLILRAQMAELSQRLESLDGIINYMNSTSSRFPTEDTFNNPRSSLYTNHPIMAANDMFVYQSF